MTVIAACLDAHGRVAIACDTGVHFRTIYHAPTKLTRVGDSVIGASGSALWTRFLAEEADAGWSLTELADQWLAWARERGHGAVEGRVWSISGELLVAHPGGVALIDGTGQVHEPTEGYVAIGAGQEAANGALWLAMQSGMPASFAVEMAVRAAVHHEAGCSGRAVVAEVSRGT